MARGGACFRARASRLCVAAAQNIDARIEALVPGAPRTSHPGLAAARSSEKVSLLEGESGLVYSSVLIVLYVSLSTADT